LIDAMILGTLNAPSCGASLSPGQTVVANILIAVTICLYFACFEQSWLQATPGKILCSIKVVDHFGHQLSLQRAIGRNAAKYVSLLTFGIGFLMAGWTSQKQALHDKLADCIVIRLPRAAKPLKLPH
jgi:uncharacterized RDD family membrane protein YckC